MKHTEASKVVDMLLDSEEPILRHVRATNPHIEYARNAEYQTAWSQWNWPSTPVEISVDDPKLPADAAPGYKRDVRRYTKLKTPFPAIVLLDHGKHYGIADGRHRLGAARARGDQTILAYIGTPKK